MPFGIIDLNKIKIFIPPIKLTDEEQKIKEEYVVKLYNLRKPHNKIELVNQFNKYLKYDCLDLKGKKYEIKSVNHHYGQFDGEYLSIEKLGICDEKGIRIIYHFLNDDLYYIDYSASAFKNKWFKNSNKPKMVYIPCHALKKCKIINLTK